MTRNGVIAALLALCVGGMAGCSKPAPQDDGLPDTNAAAAVSAPAAPPAVATLGDGSTDVADFTVDPGQVFSCEGRDRATSTVKWSVKDPSVVTVKVLVGERGSSEMKTFAAGANIGEAATGNWVTAGVTFTLVDGKDDRVLATYEVPALSCN